MPLDNASTVKTADYRRFAGGHLLDAAKYAFSGDYWLANYEAGKARDWLDRAAKIDKANADAERTARECAEFDAAMAACMPAAPATASISLSAPMEDGRPMFQHINDAMLGRT